VANVKAGAVLERQGDIAGAGEAYRQAVAIMETLAPADRSNADWQQELAEDYAHLAAIQVKRGENAAAVVTLGKGHDLMMALIEADPDYPQWKEALQYFDRQIAAQGPLARETAKQ
jgi:hypothetical protein